MEYLDIRDYLVDVDYQDWSYENIKQHKPRADTYAATIKSINIVREDSWECVTDVYYDINTSHDGFLIRMPYDQLSQEYDDFLSALAVAGYQNKPLSTVIGLTIKLQIDYTDEGEVLLRHRVWNGSFD